MQFRPFWPCLASCSTMYLGQCYEMRFGVSNQFKSTRDGFLLLLLRSVSTTTKPCQGCSVNLTEGTIILHPHHRHQTVHAIQQESSRAAQQRKTQTTSTANKRVTAHPLQAILPPALRSGKLWTGLVSQAATG